MPVESGGNGGLRPPLRPAAALAAGKRPRTEVAAAPEVLLQKMQRLDPGIKQEDYRWAGRDWDEEGMAEDLRLMTEVFSSESLEAALQPMRQEMHRLASQHRHLRKGTIPGAVVVVPGVVALGDATFARDLKGLKMLGVRRIVNCSPQTVRTGITYYQSDIPGIQYMELWEDDLEDYCVLQDLERVMAFATAGGLCLVHCEQGVNRSCALAVAMRMRLRLHRGVPPEELLRASWHFVAERRARALTNESFQRQLLLFARLGLRWFPTVSGLWRKELEHRMARFRTLAERIGWEAVGSWAELPAGGRMRAVVTIRDGSMRQEKSLEKNGYYPFQTFDLSSEAKVQQAERRMRRYSGQLKQRILEKEGVAASPMWQVKDNIG